MSILLLEIQGDAGSIIHAIRAVPVISRKHVISARPIFLLTVAIQALKS